MSTDNQALISKIFNDVSGLIKKQTLILHSELTPTRSWPLNSKKMPLGRLKLQNFGTDMPDLNGK